MPQLNINITHEFDEDLSRYMKKKGISQKSDAIRRAIHEAAEQASIASKGHDYRSWLGIGLKAPLNKTPRFKNQDELWV